MSTKNGFWISFDLGLKGDYKGLYAYLDSLKAKECGDNLAYFKISSDTAEDFKVFFQNEIKKHVSLSSTDRIYLIHMDPKTKKVQGRFLFGQRKRGQWEGYSPTGKLEEEDV